MSPTFNHYQNNKNVAPLHIWAVENLKAFKSLFKIHPFSHVFDCALSFLVFVLLFQSQVLGCISSVFYLTQCMWPCFSFFLHSLNIFGKTLWFSLAVCKCAI